MLSVEMLSRAFSGADARLSKGARLLGEVQTAKDAKTRQRVRELETLRDFLQGWGAESKRNLANVERLLAQHDIDAEIATAKSHSATKRASLAREARRIAEQGKDGRNVLAATVTYLQAHRSTGALLRRVSIAPTERERKIVASIDRANAAVRTVLEATIESIDEGLDALLVYGSRVDPENDAPAKTLADLAAE